jgi:formate-dependent nitrite reductase membrane component NrfD
VKRGGRAGGGETLVVPPADFRSYYGRPIVRAPVWHHDIPAYLFTGGLAAGSSLLAAGADLTGRPDLCRAGRTASLAGLGASTYFLINDLGRPGRFYNMLRVAKPTSPMSMGTWILAAFGPAAGLAAAAELAPLLPRRGIWGLARTVAPPVGRVSGLAAAVTAPALASYTAVLLAGTAVPAWHEAYRYLPFVFTSSALASGAGVGLLAAPTAQNTPAARLAVISAAVELSATHLVETRLGLQSEAYHTGHPAKLLRTARALTVLGAVTAVLGRRSRLLCAAAGLALLSGSVATRFGIYDGGVASAKDPRYTVIPQRARLDAEPPTVMGEGDLRSIGSNEGRLHP